MESLSRDFNLDLRRLHVLRVLAEVGTVTATAAALHLTPSAVSQQLAALSREAGVPVLEKFGRRVQLTPQARILLKHAARVQEQLELARGDLGAHEAGESGRLVVGTFGSAIAGLVTPAVERLKMRRPGVDVVVVETEPPDSYPRLSTGDLDALIEVAWRGAPSANDARFSQTHLRKDPFDLLIPACHPMADQDAVDLHDFRAASWVMGVSGPCFEVSMAACHAAGFAPDVRHRVSSWNAQAALVQAGLGVALIPRLVLAGVHSDAVRRPVIQKPYRRIVLLTRRGAANSPLQTTFRSALAPASTEAG